MGKILAVDFGLARVGLALSDFNRIMAFPFKTIKFKDYVNLADKLRYITEEEEADLIVLGKPIHLSGDDSEISIKVEEFFSAFVKRNPHIEIVLFDERLTSARAGQVLTEQGISPSKNKEKLDSLAASILLEDYISKFESK